jgi:thiamine transporter
MASHVVSGIVYFGDLAPEGTSAWKYSLAYNASYLVPETILAAIATAVLVRRLPLRATTN